MAREISIGGAVAEGFGLIRSKPLAVLTWGLIQVVFMALLFSLMAPLVLTSFGELIQQAKAGGMPSPQAMERVQQFQAINYLLQFAGILVSSVFYCAVFRAVLHPEQSRFAYMRLGAAELQIALLTVAALFAFGISLALVVVVVGIVVAIFVVLHAGVVAAIIGVAGGIAAAVALVYFWLRLSLVAPMIVDGGGFDLTASWRLTKGRVGGLFAIAVVLLLILIVGEIVVGLVMVGIGLGVIGSAAGGLRNLPAFFQHPPSDIVAKLAPVLVAFAVIWVPLYGCVLAIVGAPWARVYRDLKPPSDIASTFA